MKSSISTNVDNVQSPVFIELLTGESVECPQWTLPPHASIMLVPYMSKRLRQFKGSLKQYRDLGTSETLTLAGTGHNPTLALP